MYKTMIKTLFVSILSLMIAPAAFALSGGGASSVEPGDSCETASGGAVMLKRSPGAPYSGSLTVSYEGMTQNGTFKYSVVGNLSQFGSDCVAAVDTAFLTNDPTLFGAFSGRDVAKVCLQNVVINAGCDGSDTGYMEIITGKNPQEITTDIKTVEVIVSPLRSEF